MIKTLEDYTQVRKLRKYLTGKIVANFFITGILNINLKIKVPNFSEYLKKYLTV